MGGGGREEKNAESKCSAVGGLERWCHAVGEFLSWRYGGSGGSSLDADESSGRAGGSSQVGGSRDSNSSSRVRPALGDLEVTPDIFSMTFRELQHVRDLTIRKPNVGEVTFQGSVDISQDKRLLEDLPSLVRLELGEVVLYPDPSTKPLEGEGLNRPATITLYQCMPPNNGALADANAKTRYRDRIAQMTE